MANYIECDKLFNGFEKVPLAMGWYVIPIYGIEFSHIRSINEWIEKNIDGDWSTFQFDSYIDPDRKDLCYESGRSYCFFDINDAMAFRLRWE